MSSQRYQTLKTNLKNLDYIDSFGVDALDLVEKLYNDLVTTTKSYQFLQTKESKLVNDLQSLQSQLFPLRKENAKLARENNELHLDHIRQIEENRNTIDNFTGQIRKLNEEIMQLKLLNKVSTDQLKSKDSLIEKLREAYETISDPALKAKRNLVSSIKTSSKAPKGTDIDDNTSILFGKSFTTDDQQYTVIIESLKSQLSSLQNKVLTQEEELSKLQLSVAAREQELTRASRVIGNAAARIQTVNGDNLVMTNVASGFEQNALDTANKRIIDQLNGQVDFLNSQLAFREAQLTTLHTQVSEYNNMKIELNAKNDFLEKIKEENNKMSSRMHLMENKLLSMSSTIMQQQKSIEDSKQGKLLPPLPFNLPEESNSVVETRENTNQDLLNAITELSKEKELLSIRLEETTKSIKAITSKYEMEIKSLQDQLTELTSKSIKPSVSSQTSVASNQSIPVSEAKEDMNQDLLNEISQLSKEKELLSQRLEDISHYYQVVVSKNEMEINSLKDQLTELTSKSKSPLQSPSPSVSLSQNIQVSEAKEDSNLDLLNEISQLSKEKELLSQRLEDTTHYYQMILSKNEMEINSLHDQLTELTSKSIKLSASSPSPSVSLSQNIQVSEAKEDSNQDLLNEISQLSKEKELLSQRLDDTTKYNKMITTKYEMEIQSLKDQMAEILQSTELKRSSTEDLEQRLIQSNHNLIELDKHYDDLQSIYDDLEDKYLQLKNDYSIIQNDLQEQIKRYDNLKSEKQSKDQEYQTIQQFNNRLTEKYNNLVQQYQDKELQLKNIYNDTTYQKQDLSLMIKENQFISNELSTLQSKYASIYQESNKLKEQLEYCKQEIYGKDIEKEDILSHYKLLVKENQVLSENIQALNSAQHATMSSTQTFQQQINTLEQKIQVYINQEERFKIEKTSFLSQIDLLNDQLHQITARFDALEVENRRLTQEAIGLRQSNSMLNERLSIIMKRAAASGEANKVLTSRLSTIERERDAARSVIDLERQRNADMTKVVEAARVEAATKDIQLQRLKQEFRSPSGSKPTSPQSV